MNSNRDFAPMVNEFVGIVGIGMDYYSMLLIWRMAMVDWVDERQGA